MLEKHDIIRGLLHGCDFDSSALTCRPHERLAQHAKVLDFVMADPDRTARFLDQVLALPRRSPYAARATRPRPSATTLACSPTSAPRSSRSRTPTPGGLAAGPWRSTPPSGSWSTKRSPPTRSSTSTSWLASRRRSCRSCPTSSSTAWSTRTSPTSRWGCCGVCSTTRSGRCSAPTSSRPGEFSEQLDEAINRYTNRALTTAEIIAELVKLAKEMRDQSEPPRRSSVSRSAEAAFYDAIVQNDAAVLQMGDDILKRMRSRASRLNPSTAQPSTGTSRNRSEPPCAPRSAGCSQSTTTRPTMKRRPSSWFLSRRSCLLRRAPMVDSSSAAEPRARLLDDLPVDIDKFAGRGHTAVAHAIASVVCSEPGGRVLGLQGPWGSGKSTIVRLLGKEIEARDKSDKDDVGVFTFDAWAHQGDPLRRSFLEQLLDQLAEWHWIPEADRDTQKGRLSGKTSRDKTKSSARLTPEGLAASLAALVVPIGAAAFANHFHSWHTPLIFAGAVLLLAPFLVVLGFFVGGAAARQLAPDSRAAKLPRFSFFAKEQQTETETERIEGGQPTSVEFEDIFAKALAGCLTDGKRLVIVLDNLDRVDQPVARELFATMQTFTGTSTRTSRRGLDGACLDSRTLRSRWA